MATVRIYKVAELLNTSSQEVLALLKRAHGIELKSASSTIEEVVARQFVERLARERNITLPGGDMFAEGPVVEARRQEAGPQRQEAGAGKARRADTRAAAARENGEAGCACRDGRRRADRGRGAAAPVEEPEEDAGCPPPRLRRNGGQPEAACTGCRRTAAAPPVVEEPPAPRGSDLPPHGPLPPHLLRHRGPRLRRDAWCRRASD